MLLWVGHSPFRCFAPSLQLVPVLARRSDLASPSLRLAADAIRCIDCKPHSSAIAFLIDASDSHVQSTNVQLPHYEDREEMELRLAAIRSSLKRSARMAALADVEEGELLDDDAPVASTSTTKDSETRSPGRGEKHARGSRQRAARGERRCTRRTLPLPL